VIGAKKAQLGSEGALESCLSSLLNHHKKEAARSSGKTPCLPIRQYKGVHKRRRRGRTTCLPSGGSRGVGKTERGGEGGLGWFGGGGGGEGGWGGRSEVKGGFGGGVLYRPGAFFVVEGWGGKKSCAVCVRWEVGAWGVVLSYTALGAEKKKRERGGPGGCLGGCVRGGTCD